MIASGAIAAVHVGRPATLAGAGRRGAGLVTAYAKIPVSGAIAAHALGLEGDTQVNRRWHGGPEKAIYGYPLSGYAAWRVDLPGLADRFVPGAMGENLVVTGLDESTVHLGDIIRCGTALLQVAQIREPCATFTAVIGTPRAARIMARTGRCGWYYRVLEPGGMGAGDCHDVVDRPNPDWPISRFTPMAAGIAGTLEAWRELSTLPGLNPDWQARAAQVLATQQPALNRS